MVFGQPVYNTEQRRAILGQMKQYLDKEWLRRRAAGLLTKENKKFDTIRFPISKKRKPFSSVLIINVAQVNASWGRVATSKFLERP